jgi:protein O-mannosyl-transferase
VSAVDASRRLHPSEVHPPSSPALRRVLPPAAIAALALAAYANSFGGDFVFDSVGGLRDNARLRDLAGFFEGTTQFLNDNRWFGYFTFALNYAFHGLEVTGYHVVNLAIHLVSALLVYALVRVAFKTPRLRASTIASWSTEIAFVAGAVFVVHPIQTQAVSYIVQRFTSLAALFYLLSIVQYACWRVWREEGGRSARRDALAWAGIVGAAILAMKSKEIAFTLPFAAVAFDLIFFDTPARLRARYLAPLVATLPIIPLARLGVGTPLDAVVSAVSDATRVQTALSRADYLATQLPVVATYLRLVVLPIGQNVEHDIPIRHSFLAPDVIACGALLVALVALAGYLLRRTSRSDSRPLDPGWRLVAFGIIWFFVAISVESSVIPIVDLMFEHRVYLPLAGLLAAVATALALLVRDRTGARRAFVTGGVAIALALAAATFARNRVWEDELTLWADAARKSPGKARVHQNLGVALASAGRLEEAVQAFTAANRIDPANVDIVNNLGAALRDLGRVDEAAWWLRIAVQGRADLPDPHFNLGLALMDDPATAEEAVAMFERAIALRPGHARSYANLAATLNRLGRFDETVARLERAGTTIAGSAEARFNLAVAYAMVSNHAGARRELAAVARLDAARAQQLAAFLGQRAAAR